MPSHSIFVIVGALAAVAHSSPLALPVPVQLPASQDTQLSIQNLQQTIVDLANDISQSNPSNAQTDYNTANDQFGGLGQVVLTPTTYQCPPSTSVGQITSSDSALASLVTAQNDLSTLSLHLQDQTSSEDMINQDFCHALADFSAIHDYVFSSFGQS